MNKEQKELLLEATDSEMFDFICFQINRKYIESIDWMDDDILKHFLKLNNCETKEEYEKELEEAKKQTPNW